MPKSRPVAGIVWIVSALWCWSSGASAEEGAFLVLPENNTTVTVLRGGEPYLDIQFVGWGPNWSWMGLDGSVREQGAATQLTSTAQVGGSGAEIQLSAAVTQTGPRQVKLEMDLRTNRDTPLTYIVVSVSPADSRFARGTARAHLSDGSLREVAMPLDKKGLGESVRRFELVDADGAATRVTLDPPGDIPTDGAARIVLAGGLLRAAAPARTTITIDLPDDVTYFTSGSRVPADRGTEDWYVFQPGDDPAAPSEIGLQDWLEKPAGKFGRLVRQADKLLYHGQPIKLWGVNLCYGACAPDKELAKKRACFYAKYGINAVRLHKYADGPGWAGVQSKDSFVAFDPESLDRMDYQVAQFKERGIYVKLSAHFGAQKLGPGDRQYVPYLEEFGSFSGDESRITTPHSAVHYAPELQDVQIRQMVNLLQHQNPYTGLSYAEDPAVAFVEIINEQSILFYSSMEPLKASPTIRRHVARRFCQWLRQKYGSQARLTQAWGGARAFDSFDGDGFPPVGEQLDQDNILPLGNPWYWDPVQLTSSQAFRRQRLMDSLLFLYELQNEFYARYVDAVRVAGYQGEIVASNWQAGRAQSHYYNLHSDALVGTVDRHNYFGGGSNTRIDNASMLALPGSGILSAGMQQVADRPFMLSEWIHVAPSEWGVEGPAVIGAYGMGLQGWDVSFMFQNSDRGGFNDKIGKDRWEVAAPHVLGVFPAVARQVLRGDVKQSDLAAPCFVHVPSLAEGKLGFTDQVAQQHDVKAFETDKVPAQALAVARCVVEFADAYRDTPPFDVSPYLENGAYRSSTDQLFWTPGTSKLDGYFTLNTDATKAVVGFAEGQRCALGTVCIEPKCRYAAVYVTAREREQDLATSHNLLVVALARARNQGMQVLHDTLILQPGRGPVVLEPVKADITIRRPGSPTVHVLDHSGAKTGQTLPMSGQMLHIDGARDKTCYYLIEYPQ